MQSINKEAVLFTLNKYPEGDAGSIRDRIIADLLTKIGFNVDIVGLGENTNAKFKNETDALRYFSFRSKSGSYFSKLRLMLGYFFGVGRILKTKKYDLIIYDTLLPLTTLRLFMFAKRHRIPIIHNSVEWYSACEFKLGILSPQFLLNRLTITLAAKFASGVLSISTFLMRYFLSRQVLSLNLPFIIDATKYTIHDFPVPTTESRIVFTYAGNPGRKDDMKGFLLALSKLNSEEKERLQVRIVGVTREELSSLQNIGDSVHEKLRSVVTYYGRVSKAEADRLVASSHFTFLFRDETRRFAKAGFPTKIVESLAMGIPVFCNLSSDLSNYLANNIHAVLADSSSPQDIHVALRKCLVMEHSMWQRMSVSARDLAKSQFHYENYIPSMALFVNDIEDKIGN